MWVKGDRLGEYDESFRVNLSGAVGASISSGFGSVLGLIIDEEPSLVIFSTTGIREGHGGTKSLTFTVTLSAPYDQAVTVRYATQDGTAVAGSDYNATSGTLTFAPGQTTKTVTVKIRGDRTREADESLYVVLSDFSRNTMIPYDPYGLGFILNDD